MRHLKKNQKFSLQRGAAKMFFRAPLWLSMGLGCTAYSLNHSSSVVEA